MSGILVFRVPHQLDMAELLAETGTFYPVQEAGEEVVDALYYDTFDWRLLKEQLMLYRRGEMYTLAGVSGEVLLKGERAGKKNPCCWNFRGEELRERLKPVIEVRALLPQFRLNLRQVHFSLLNSDEKTVLRLKLVNGSGLYRERQFTLQPVLLVEPLRGYHRACSRVCELLTSRGLIREDDGYDRVSRVLTTLSVDPRETESKFSAKLQEWATVGQAVADIALILRSIMLCNLPGTLDDIDTEFLHDLRVSMRRTRSLLSLMKKYLPAEDTSHFQKEFKWLGNVTGPVRDLDVYLLKTSEYQAVLPVELHPGLSWFFAGLSRRRKRELRLLRKHLRSKRFAELMERWRRFLTDLPDRDDCQRAQKVCREVAEKTIRKRFARILEKGDGITPSTPDEQLHELRIEGKKFRYLLEFFRSLFNLESVDAYLKQMKRLQNNLGEYNDLTVQKRMLVQRLTGLGRDSEHDVETAAALGGLIVHLTADQHQVRAGFEEIFADFAASDNIELLKSIFSDKRSAHSEEQDPA